MSEDYKNERLPLGYMDAARALRLILGWRSGKVGNINSTLRNAERADRVSETTLALITIYEQLLKGSGVLITDDVLEGFVEQYFNAAAFAEQASEDIDALPMEDQPEAEVHASSCYDCGGKARRIFTVYSEARGEDVGVALCADCAARRRLTGETEV